MFRFLVTAILLLGTKAFCVIDFDIADLKKPSKIIELIDDQPSFGYIGCGNMHLILKDFDFALKDFQKAEACLYSYSYPLDEPSPWIQFMLYFGYTVVYDNLGLSDKCNESIGRMILLCSGVDDEEDDEEEDNTNDDPLDPDAKLLCDESVKMLAKIAQRAPSEEVRNFLLSVVKYIGEAFNEETQNADEEKP